MGRKQGRKDEKKEEDEEVRGRRRRRPVTEGWKEKKNPKRRAPLEVKRFAASAACEWTKKVEMKVSQSLSMGVINNRENFVKLIQQCH